MYDICCRYPQSRDDGEERRDDPLSTPKQSMIPAEPMEDTVRYSGGLRVPVFLLARTGNKRQSIPGGWESAERSRNGA